MSKKHLVTAAIAMAFLLAACSEPEALVESGSAQDTETTNESSEESETGSVADDSAVIELTAPPPTNRVREGSPYFSDLDPGSDEDGDGVVNALDLLPLDPSVGWDTDGDLIGDTVDSDDDNDGVLDEDDAFPLDPSGWSDINADSIADSRQWDITGDREVDRFVSERAQWGFATDLDDLERHFDAAVTSGISGVLSEEEGQRLELARSRVQDEGARELVRWLEDHPSYVSTRTVIRGGGFVVLESSWTQEELVADGLPLELLDDPSIVRFETRPYSLSEIRAGILGDVERLAAIEEETGLTFAHEDYANTYGLTFFAVTHDPELPLLGESTEVLAEWRASIAEPFRSIIYIDEPDVSDAWLLEEQEDELPEEEEAELPEDQDGELPQDEEDELAELPEDEDDELPEDQEDELAELPEDEDDELPEDAAGEQPSK